jgi:hypothetical protein
MNRNFYCNVLRKLRKISGTNVQSNSATIPGTCTITMHPPTLFLAKSTKTTVKAEPPYSSDLTPCDFFVSENKTEAQGVKFWEH